VSRRLERMFKPGPNQTRNLFSQSEYENNSDGWPSPEAKKESTLVNLHELEFLNHYTARHSTQKQRQQLDTLSHVGRNSQVPPCDMINHLRPGPQRQRDQSSRRHTLTQINKKLHRGGGKSSNNWEAEEMTHFTPNLGNNGPNAVEPSILTSIEEEFMRIFTMLHENHDAEVLRNDLTDSIKCLNNPPNGIHVNRNIKPELYKTEICRR